MTESDFVPENDPAFVPYPDEPRWGGTGPSDRNSKRLPDAAQEEEDAENGVTSD